MDIEQQKIHDFQNNQLSLDDTFKFHCKGCGKCCKNRDDLLLTPRDLYNIAKHLGRTTEQIIKRYCEFFIGESSRVTLVQLKPVDLDNRCPLLYDNRCIVHKAKPTICALYPLGRGYSTSDGRSFETIDPVYFIQNVNCGEKTQTQTVRSWLEKFGVPINDEFHYLWAITVMRLSEFCIKFEKENKKDLVNKLNMVIFSLLYLNYDTNINFLLQFIERAMALNRISDSEDMTNILSEMPKV